MLRLVRTAAVGLVAALLVALVVVGVNLGPPAGASLRELAARSWHGLTAELDGHVFGHPLQGANELLVLDPGLHGRLSQSAARYLVAASPDPAQRLTLAGRLYRRGLLGEPTLLDVLAEVLATGRHDLLSQVAGLARTLPPGDRALIANDLASPAVVGSYGPAWRQPLQAALSVARTPYALNELAIRTPNAVEALGLLSEAHRLVPNDVIIAANWAMVEKASLIAQGQPPQAWAGLDTLLRAGAQASGNPAYSVALAWQPRPVTVTPGCG